MLVAFVCFTFSRDVLETTGAVIKNVHPKCYIFVSIIFTLCMFQVVCLIKELVSKSLVIEELPSAILKKDTKFAATLRLLVGGHFGIKMNLPEVLLLLSLLLFIVATSYVVITLFVAVGLGQLAQIC